MSTLSYRPFSEGDVDSARQLLTDEGELSAYAAAVLEDGELVAWGAFEGERLVGAVLTRQLPDDDDAYRGGVEELVVARSHRGRGVGRRLLEMAEAHYRALGLAGMRLTVREDNEPAMRLYQSMGYGMAERRIRMRKQF